jgi:hypothetical protein
MADIFISYAREDRAAAERIARGLNGMGLEVFWDTEIPPGQTWADYIEGKLTQCRAVIVLWSESSTKSQWVREEARMGREKAKLIPVLLDGTPAPFGFGEVQAADLSAWTGDQNHPDWVRFSRAVYATAAASCATTASRVVRAAAGCCACVERSACGGERCGQRRAGEFVADQLHPEMFATLRERQRPGAAGGILVVDARRVRRVDRRLRD